MITTLCPSCNWTGNVDVAEIGRRAQCPHCAHKYYIKVHQEIALISTSCPNCTWTGEIEARHAGRKGQCPDCLTKYYIGEQEDSPSSVDEGPSRLVLFFSKKGIFIWGPLILTTLIVIGYHDTSTTVSGRHGGKAQLLKVVAATIGLEGIYFLGGFSLLIGSAIFFFITRKKAA